MAYNIYNERQTVKQRNGERKMNELKYTIKMTDNKTGETVETFAGMTFSVVSAFSAIQEFVEIDLKTFGERRYKYELVEAE